MSSSPKDTLHGWDIFRRLLSEQRAFLPHIGLLLFLQLLAAPLMLLGPLAIKIAVDSYIGEKPLPSIISMLVPDVIEMSALGELWIAAGLLVLVAVITQLQGLMAALLRVYTQERSLLEFRKRIFPHVARLPLSYHDDKGSSDSSYKILYDTAMLPSILIDGIIPFVSSIILLSAMVVVVGLLSWKLAVIALAVVPVLLYVTIRFGLRLRSQWHEVKALDSSALKILQEVFGAIRVVKAFGREEAEKKRLVKVTTTAMWAKIRTALTRSKLDASVAISMATGSAVAIFVGMQQVTSGDLTLGELLMVLAYLTQLYAPLQMLISQFAEMQGALASAERVLSLMEESPEVTESQKAIPLKRARGDIEFRDVSFSYDADTPILDEVTATIAAGERVGVVGETGAGKTSLVNLLTRLYDPSEGTILLDGKDLRDYKLADLRRQFGIVLQDSVLFSTSIAENIAYTKPDSSQEDIENAARLAEAHEFILGLPDGYETIVGERGMRLSGGERQRISIARAFLRDAPILIMDEPTSSVDTQTEASIVATLNRLMKDRTAILITHRESALIGCEQVLMLEKGRLHQVRQEVLDEHIGGPSA